MRVLFLGIGAEQLGVQQLSAILKRDGHQVGLAFTPSLFDDKYHLHVPVLARLFSRDRQVVEQAVAFRPDVVAFSALTMTYRWGLQVAAEVKRRTGAKVIFGGVHPSAVPEVVIADPVVDAICVGEGDVAFPAWLRALEQGDTVAAVDQIWFKRADGVVVRGKQRPFLQDLDALPVIDKGLYEDHVRIRDVYITMTGRGCPYRCTFCFNNFWARLPGQDGVAGGKYVRQRSVDHVIAELVEAKKRWKIRYVDFEDDIFTIDKVWLHEFLERYRREVGLPWMCLTHPKYVDQDIVDGLAAAGCEWVQLGIQSVDEQHRFHTMKRYEKVGDTAWAIDAFRKAGVGVKGDHILGSVGEGVASQELARAFYATHTPSRISPFWMTWLPGVDITRQALDSGNLTPEQLAGIERGDPTFFRQSSVRDPQLRRRLQSYAALFQLMPVLPAPLRRRLRPAWLDHVPVPVLDKLTMATDLVAGFASGNPEHAAYARFYLTHMARRVWPRSR
jgi:radical SAM superfamily enzyme YgiQ (UPF0313 family)